MILLLYIHVLWSLFSLLFILLNQLQLQVRALTFCTSLLSVLNFNNFQDYIKKSTPTYKRPTNKNVCTTLGKPIIGIE